MTRFITLCILGLVASSAALNNEGRMVQRRSPRPAPGQVGSIDLHYVGLIRRQATAPKVVIGKSNPVASVAVENSLSDDAPTSGSASGNIVPFGTKLAKRQTGAAPVVVVGSANPPIAAQDVNPVGEVDPVSGSNDGNIKTFQAGGVRRRSLDLNLLSHEIAARGFADGSIIAI